LSIPFAVTPSQTDTLTLSATTQSSPGQPPSPGQEQIAASSSNQPQVPTSAAAAPMAAPTQETIREQIQTIKINGNASEISTQVPGSRSGTVIQHQSPMLTLQVPGSHAGTVIQHQSPAQRSSLRPPLPSRFPRSAMASPMGGPLVNNQQVGRSPPLPPFTLPDNAHDLPPS
jgi:hypothetical protein